MKTQTKINNLPKVTITDADKSFDFLKEKSLFDKKYARAKQILKGMKLPPH